MFLNHKCLFHGSAIHTASLLYLLLPAALFAFGWLRLWALILSLTVLTVCGYALIHSLVRQKQYVSLPVWYLAVIAAALLFWMFFSGIGNFSYQNMDYYVRNPIYNDLIDFSWPLRYDLSLQTADIQAICGSDHVGFVYYFVFWLPPALLSKLLGMRQLWLFVWCFAGLCLVLLELHLYLQKVSLLIPTVFICFSGLDFIPYFLQEGLVKTAHMEWWAGHLFQYSSNTTLLYWVFNQAIPLWLIVSCLLNLNAGSNAAALCSLSFLYSPFAVFGMIPLALWAVKNGGSLRALRTPENWLMPLYLLGIYGSFYLSKSSSLGSNGLIFLLEDSLTAVKWYIPFVFLEVGVYILCLHKVIFKYDYLLIAALELVLIPLYKLTDANDFCMRASIPALFILCVSVTRYLLENQKRICAVLALCLVVGTATPTTEILRSVKYTLNNGESANLIGESFSSMELGRYEYAETLVETVDSQFFAHQWEISFFEQYIGK